MASRATGSPPPVPWRITWAVLQTQGWTADDTQAKTMYFPPGVTRENGNKRVNYFDSKKQVRNYIANLQSAVSPPSAAAAAASHKRPRSAERFKSPPEAQASPRKQLDLRELKAGQTRDFPGYFTGRWDGGQAKVVSISANKIVVARSLRRGGQDKGLEEISRQEGILWPSSLTEADSESSPMVTDQTAVGATPGTAQSESPPAPPAEADLTGGGDDGDGGQSAGEEGELVRTYLIRTIPPPRPDGSDSDSADGSAAGSDVYVPKKRYDQTLRLQLRFRGASESSTVDRTKDELGTVAAIATEHLEHMCFPHTELVAPTMLRWAFSKVRPVLWTAVITIFVDRALLACCVCRRPREAVPLGM